MNTLTRDELIQKVDQLHHHRKLTEVLDLLIDTENQFPEDPQILWRLARAYLEMAEDKPDDANWKKKHRTQGLVHAEKALKLDENHFAILTWYAVLLASVGEFMPAKDKISNAPKIKEYALKAIQLKPDYGESHHLLGRWCYDVTSISWVERKIAAALFGVVPESSYEEALEYLLRCAELKPTFFPNLMFTADCYSQLKQYDKAKEFYQKMVDLPAFTDGDKVIQSKAKAKLSKL